MRRLGSELQWQAKIVDQLNDSSHGGSCSAKLLQQLQQELQRLDLQSSELKTQVQAESQAQQLLKRLSGFTLFLSFLLFFVFLQASCCFSVVHQDINDEDDDDNSNNKGGAHLCTQHAKLCLLIVCVQRVCVCEPRWVW